MDQEKHRVLEKIAGASMEKCMANLSRVSAGKWHVGGVNVSRRSMEESIHGHAEADRVMAAVYFQVKGEYPFTSMVIFRPEDVELLSRGFLGFSFSKLPGLTQAQELLISELGNVILNSFISALSNALHRSFLPSAPKYVNGATQFLLEALWATIDGEQPHSLVTVALDLQCDTSITRSEVVAVVPERRERAVMAG